MIEVVEPGAQRLRRVPRGIGRHEHDADARLLVGGQPLERRGDVVEMRRTDVGTVGVAEVQQRRRAARVSDKVKGPPVRILEREIGFRPYRSELYAAQSVECPRAGIDTPVSAEE